MVDKYYQTIYNVLSDMLPSSVNLRFTDINSGNKLSTLLTKLYKIMGHIQLSNPMEKAVNMITISIAVNNIVSEKFIPQNLKNVRESIALQQIAFTYLKSAILLLQNNSCELYFEDINDLNYYMCVMESNMAITISANRGTVYIGTEELNNQIQSIINRIEKLIRRNPKHEYYTLQSILYHHLGQPNKAMEVSKTGYINSTSQINLTNISNFQYKAKLSGKLCPVEIYK